VASKSLVKWLKMLWENWGCVCVVCRMLSVVLCLVLCVVSLVPCGGGVHLPFIGQGEGELQACHTIQLHGEVWCVAP
jgi:hypothetical protein